MQKNLEKPEPFNTLLLCPMCGYWIITNTFMEALVVSEPLPGQEITVEREGE